MISNFKFFFSLLSFHGYYKLRFSRRFISSIFVPGHKHFFSSLHNSFKNQRAFVIGNGPSLADMNLDLLTDEVTIGSNGIYKIFDKYKFRPKYLLFQDSRTILGKANEINELKGIPKLVALNSSHLVKKDKYTFFFNLADHLGWENIKSSTRKEFQGNIPIFSNNFGEFATNMGNVSHTAIQFAFFLGCNPVYLIGCDHSMADLIGKFEPGHVKITEENLPIFEKYHFTQNYYKIGDEIGVPFIELENQAYKSCYEFFKLSGKKLINAGIESKVPYIPKINFKNLF